MCIAGLAATVNTAAGRPCRHWSRTICRAACPEQGALLVCSAYAAGIPTQVKDLLCLLTKPMIKAAMKCASRQLEFCDRGHEVIDDQLSHLVSANCTRQPLQLRGLVL